MLKGKCRIIVQKRGDNISKVLIYIPLDIARDSQFPYKENTTANLEVTPSENKILIHPNIDV